MKIADYEIGNGHRCLRIATSPGTPTNRFPVIMITAVKFLRASFTSKPNTIGTGIFFAGSFNLNVFSGIRKKLKIFQAVIRSLTIFVVNYFTRLQKSANVPFHYEAMFENIAGFTSSGMTPRFYENISITVSHFAAFPAAIIRHFTSAPPPLIACQCFANTLMAANITDRTLYSYLTWIKRLMENCRSTTATAFGFNHNLDFITSEIGSQL